MTFLVFGHFSGPRRAQFSFPFQVPIHFLPIPVDYWRGVLLKRQRNGIVSIAVDSHTDNGASLAIAFLDFPQDCLAFGSMWTYHTYRKRRLCNSVRAIALPLFIEGFLYRIVPELHAKILISSLAAQKVHLSSVVHMKADKDITDLWRSACNLLLLLDRSLENAFRHPERFAEPSKVATATHWYSSPSERPKALDVLCRNALPWLLRPSRRPPHPLFPDTRRIFGMPSVHHHSRNRSFRWETVCLGKFEDVPFIQCY